MFESMRPLPNPAGNDGYNSMLFWALNLTSGHRDEIKIILRHLAAKDTRSFQ